MTMFEMQSRLTRDWFAAIEESARVVSEACLTTSKDTAKTWESALAGLAPRPVSPFTALWSWPWTDAARAWSMPAFGATSLPMWSAMPQFGFSPAFAAPNWGTPWSMLSMWQTPMSTMEAWPFGPAAAAPSPIASAMALQDAFATAYRTASGYAVARILETPIRSPQRAAASSPWTGDWGIWGLGR